MRKSVLVFSVAALASVLANVATLAPVNALDITSADGVTKTLTGTIDDGLYVKSDADITIKLDNATINAANFAASWAIPLVDSVSTTTFSIISVRPNEGATSANIYYYSIYAIGKWK